MLSDAPVLTRLKGMGAFGIDVDIQSLQGEEELVAFCDFVLNVLPTNRDFDLIQGYTGLFIKVSCVESICAREPKGPFTPVKYSRRSLG